jgi:DNA-binding transcriptional ArsR family regulator
LLQLYNCISYWNVFSDYDMIIITCPKFYCVKFEKLNIMKTSKQLERYFKGAANHRRIEILLLISQTPNLDLRKIASKLRCNIKTISEHSRRLKIAGLLDKKYKGNRVLHRLSPYGELFLNFMKKFK